MMSHLRLCVLVPMTVAGLLTAGVHGQTVNVSAQCGIYSAGHATVVANCDTTIGPGILPVLVDLPAGAMWVEFHDVAGSVLYCDACTPPNGPDGIAAQIQFDPLDGISGIIASRGRFFEGVFLSDAEPADPAPPSLEFTDFGFTDLSPLVAQHFFVGDGQTGTGDGEVQRFNVPAGATRLYLGFTDGFAPCVGAYSDNTGAVSASVDIVRCSGVPEVGPLEDMLVCPEGAGMFNAVASGDGPFMYQWQIQRADTGEWATLGNDPMPLACPGGGGGFAYASPLFGNPVSIVVRGCPGVQHWPIRCIVTNPCGSATADPGTLTICPADFNCDGSVTSQDFFDFLNAFFAGSASGDFNHDTVVNSQDFFDFLTAFFAGCA